ncbi:MAG: acylphosphatase [Candidatus Woesearchaeota archaeon]
MSNAIKITVCGHVQGVSFRYSVKQEAEQLGISGWAKNLPDGCVEVVAIGPKMQVRQLVEKCKDGPPAAHVESIKISQTSANVSGFLIL